MPRVYLLYGVSGLISLSYQVVWFRIYVDRFGSTNLTFAMVLCTFIGGLGAGAIASRSVADRLARSLGLHDRLRIYGFVELLVTLTVLLTVLTRWIPADAWGSFPYALDGGVYAQSSSYLLSKLVIASVCVFVPCFFMGVTFPLLCDAFAAWERFPSALYAWNTLGAASGVLLVEFVFLQRFGHDTTLWIVLGLNLLIALYFLVLGGAPERLAERSAPQRSDPALGRFDVLIVCAVLSGFVAGALEADMFKRLGFLGGDAPSAMSFISFWAILAIFVASWLVRVVPALHLWQIKVAFGLAVIAYAAVWNQAHAIRRWLVFIEYAPVVESLRKAGMPAGPVSTEFPTSLTQVVVFAGIFVFPTFLLISLLLPYVCNRLQQGRRHLGVAYGANTLAFCLGVIAFTWFAPAVSIFYSMKLMLVTLAIGTALLATIPTRAPLAPWKPALAVLAFAIACLLTPRGFDRSYVTPGQPQAIHPVRAMKSNAAHTTYVVAAPDGDRLYFDNYSMSGTGHVAQVYMRLMAHFPLLAHPRPERALLVCFGVGNTAAAIATHDTIRQIDAVELNRRVIETAPEFARTNQEVYRDPRLRFIHDDGRNFLNLIDGRYDLITSEPPPPMFTGVYRLYSTEYYEQVLSHLTPRGLMTQWLPVDQLSQDATDLALATFVRAFPHSLLFVGYGQTFILVGSPSPIDLKSIERRFDEQPRVTDDLRALGIKQPVQLLARVAKGPATLAIEFGQRRAISDQRNDLTWRFPEPLRPGIVTYDPLGVLEEIAGAGLDAGPELQSRLTHLGRLRYATSFPYESLATVRPDSSPGVALADVDWQAIQWERMRYERFAEQDPNQAFAALRRALTIAEEQPDLLLALARGFADAGYHEAALNSLNRFWEIEPHDPAAQRLNVTSLLALGRRAEAIQELAQLVELEPDLPTHFQLANLLAGSGDLDGAVRHYHQVLALDPEHAETHNWLGLALEKQGDLDRALEAYDRALRLDPKLAVAHNNLGVALSRKGRFGEAAQHFREALRLDPEDANASRNLSRIEAEFPRVR